jgi:PiT family inorganic phosphate transporter
VNWAIVMAAVCNFLGVIIISLVNTRVAMTIKNMVNFQGDTKNAMIALCAAMAAIVIWAIGAWYFGIPTSESHALIAGLSGAAIALQGGLSGINGAEWVKEIYGLLLSTVLGFGVGFLICKGITVICGKIDRRKLDNFFTKGQIVGGAAMAFMHGAQDGQKFIGVLLLALYLVNDMDTTGGAVLPVWMMVLCSIIMGVGTSIGGKKIIKSVGMDMVKLEKYQGFSADIAAAISLLICSIFSLPVSTTHAKTTSIMGVGAVKRVSAINFSVVREMVLTWVLTFPGCGLVGYIMTKLFMFVFM